MFLHPTLYMNPNLAFLKNENSFSYFLALILATFLGMAKSLLNYGNDLEDDPGEVRFINLCVITD